VLPIFVVIIHGRDGFLFFLLGAYIALNFKQELINLFSKNVIKGKHGAILFVVFYSILVYIDLKVPTSPMPFDMPLRLLIIILVSIFFLNIDRVQKQHSEFAFVLYCPYTIWAFPLLKIVHTLFNKFSTGLQDFQKIFTFLLLMVLQ